MGIHAFCKEGNKDIDTEIHILSGRDSWREESRPQHLPKKNIPYYAGNIFMMPYPPLYASIIFSLFRSRFSEPISFSISPNSGLTAHAIANDVEH